MKTTEKISSRCDQCGEYRKNLIKGICIFCLHGYGGSRTKEVRHDNIATGKALRDI